MEGVSERIQVGGRRIHQVRGGSGRPLLYLHSAAGEALWLAHLEALAQHCEVHAPAHPGFLGSEGLEQIRDIHDYVQHYLSYLDARGWDSVDVVGVSLGGWIGAELAARYPERVSRLVLVGSVGIWIRDTPLADIFAVVGRDPAKLPALLFHDASHPMARHFDVTGGAARGRDDQRLAGFMNAMAATARVGWNPLLHDPRLEELLPRVSAKTLCLWGEGDRISPPAYARRFAERIPGASVEIVPKCGHLVPLEKTEAFATAVRGFLG